MTRGLIALLVLPGCIYVEKDADSTTETAITTGTVPGTVGGTAGATNPDPDGDGDGFPASTDCDDTNPAINPDALEACDGIDNNCDEGVDDAAAATLDDVNYASLDELWAEVGDGSAATVCPGAWTITSAMLDAGAVSLTASGERDATTITETAAGTAFFVTGSGSLTLDGLTISGSSGQAIDIDEGGTVNLLNSRLTANGSGVSIYAGTNGLTPTLNVDGSDLDANVNASGDGGAVRAELGAAVSIANSNLTGNSALRGGAVWASATFVPMTLSITDSLIDGNTAEDGGGLWLTNVSLDGTGTTVSNNTATDTGGGVVLTEAEVTGLTVTLNTAVNGGGVAAMYNPTFLGNPFNPDLEGVTVSVNTAENGGGIWVDQQTTVTLDAASILRLNGANVAGGGAWLDAGTAVIVSAADTGSIAAYNDNTPDDVASGAPLTMTFDDLTPFECNGLGCL